MAQQKIVNTTQGLRQVLIDTIQDLRSKKTDPTTANSISHLAKTVIDSARLDLQVAKLKKQSQIAAQGTKLIGGAKK